MGAVGTSAVLVGIAAGAGTAYLVNEHRFADEICEYKEACKTARIGSYTGAGISAAGVLATVAVTGADMAGLAAIGGAVGSGALAGAATLVAAPIIVTAAVGYGAYWVCRTF